MHSSRWQSQHGSNFFHYLLHPSHNYFCRISVYNHECFQEEAVLCCALSSTFVQFIALRLQRTRKYIEFLREMRKVVLSSQEKAQQKASHPVFNGGHLEEVETFCPLEMVTSYELILMQLYPRLNSDIQMSLVKSIFTWLI